MSSDENEDTCSWKGEDEPDNDNGNHHKHQPRPHRRRSLDTTILPPQPLPSQTSLRRLQSAPAEMEIPTPWSVFSFDSGDYSLYNHNNNRSRPTRMIRNRKRRQRRMSGLVAESLALVQARAAAINVTSTTSPSLLQQQHCNEQQQGESSSDKNMEHLMTSFRKSVQILRSRTVIRAPTTTTVQKTATPSRIDLEKAQRGDNDQIVMVQSEEDDNQSEYSEQQSSTALPPRDATGIDDDDDSQTKKLVRLSKPTPWMSILYLTVFSMLGVWLRIFLGRLFGNECQIEGGEGDDIDGGASTGIWLQDKVVTQLNLCVTSNGQATSPGGFGALFADLPANMLGCFFMGLLQPTHDLNLLSDVPLSFLPVRHWFQTCHVLHLGLRTGFCGSLTTLASWNAQMVAMMDGSVAANGESQFFSALVGYMIGLQCAMASLGTGQMCAVWLHRYTNPQMAKEEDIVMFAYSKAVSTSNDAAVDKADHRPYAINKKLPDYERRYLANLLPKEQQEWAKKNVSALDYLEKWKISTDEYRLVGDLEDDTLAALHEIERRILVDDEGELPDRLIKVAERYNWNIHALQAFENAVKGTWISGTTVDHEGDDASQASRSPTVTQPGVFVSLPIVLAIAVLLAYVVLDLVKSEETGSAVYRQTWLSILLAPFGTLVRWKLTRLNGSLKGRFDWLPVGTFLANIFACLISAITIGLMFSVHEWSDNGLHILYAVQTGFSGCMSTVSTYAVEGHMLQKSFPHHAKASLYIGGTLVVACILGLVVYIPIVRTL